MCSKVSRAILQFNDQILLRPRMTAKAALITTIAIVAICAATPILLAKLSAAIVIKVVSTSLFLSYVIPSRLCKMDRSEDSRNYSPPRPEKLNKRPPVEDKPASSKVQPAPEPPKPVDETPKFEMVKELGINEDFIGRLTDDLDKEAPKEVIKFLERINGCIDLLIRSNVFILLVPIIEKVIVNNKIDAALKEKLFLVFKNRGLLSDKYFTPNVSLIAKNGKEFKVSLAILSLKSEYYLNVFKSNFVEGKNQKTELALNEQNVQTLVNLFYCVPINLGSKTFADCLDLHFYCSQASLKDFSNELLAEMRKKMSQTNSDSALISVLEAIVKSGSQIVPDLSKELIEAAFTAYFTKYAVGFSSRLSENVFTMPIQALHLLADPGLIGQAMNQYINSVSVGRLSEEEITKLNILETTLSPEVREKITHLHLSVLSYVDYTETIKLCRQVFPKLETGIVLAGNVCPVEVLTQLENANMPKRHLVFGEYNWRDQNSRFNVEKYEKLFSKDFCEFVHLKNKCIKVTLSTWDKTKLTEVLSKYIDKYKITTENYYGTYCFNVTFS